MTVTGPLSAHIDEDFRAAFRTWADLRHHVAHVHLLKADETSRLHQVPGVEWMPYGSTGLQARVPPGTRTGLGPSTRGVDAAYVMTRSAFRRRPGPGR